MKLKQTIETRYHLQRQADGRCGEAKDRSIDLTRRYEPRTSQIGQRTWMGKNSLNSCGNSSSPYSRSLK